MKTDRLYLEHVLECIVRVRQAVSIGRDEFLRSTLHQDAALRNLHVMAESTQRISPGAKSNHPEIDWRVISGFRSVLVHEYLGVDLDLILRIVRDDLPGLEVAIRRMLEECPPA